MGIFPWKGLEGVRRRLAIELWYNQENTKDNVTESNSSSKEKGHFRNFISNIILLLGFAAMRSGDS